MASLMRQDMCQDKPKRHCLTLGDRLHCRQCHVHFPVQAQTEGFARHGPAICLAFRKDVDNYGGYIQRQWATWWLPALSLYK